MLSPEPVYKAARDIKPGDEIDCWAAGGRIIVTRITPLCDGKVIRMHFEGMTDWLEYWPHVRVRMAAPRGIYD